MGIQIFYEEFYEEVLLHFIDNCLGITLIIAIQSKITQKYLNTLKFKWEKLKRESENNA